MKDKPSILVVDDDPNISRLEQLYLEKEGCEVRVAADGRQAVEEFRRLPPDLILLDVMLPFMDGFQVCEELRKTSFCPIIFISCLSDDKTIIRALNPAAEVQSVACPLLVPLVENERFRPGDLAVELIVEEPAVRAIARKALERKTGARGLRGIMEGIMSDVMYEIPSRKDIRQCIVTEETVEKNERPTLVPTEKPVRRTEKETA